MPSYYMHDYMLLHAAFLNYMLNYMMLSNYYMSLHAAFLHYMLNYMILKQPLNDILLAITCFRNLLHAPSHDQSFSCRGRRSPARDSHARDQRARERARDKQSFFCWIHFARE